MTFEAIGVGGDSSAIGGVALETPKNYNFFNE